MTTSDTEFLTREDWFYFGNRLADHAIEDAIDREQTYGSLSIDNDECKIEYGYTCTLRRVPENRIDGQIETPAGYEVENLKVTILSVVIYGYTITAEDIEMIEDYAEY